MTFATLYKYQFKNELSSDGRTHEHREIILNKKFLKNLYKEWYMMFKHRVKEVPKGKLIEIGSGGGFIKEYLPNVITSDIIEFPWTDETYSALDMPYGDGEVSAIFMIDTFHHIPDSKQFLKEANRVLKSKGKIIMVEPANSRWGGFIYKNFHHEPFDGTGDWTIPERGPLTGANGALPWIVFERDKDLFSKLFPHLNIKSIQYHTPFRYLLSGGVSYKGILPGFSFPLFRLIDKLFARFSKDLSMFFTIEIEKD